MVAYHNILLQYRLYNSFSTEGEIAAWFYLEN
jgi:hypothetical protein